MNALSTLLYRATAGLRCRVIEINDRPYLERYFLFSVRGVTAYLHRFISSDDERNVHDHPWRWAFALILCGGYQEERLRWFDPASGWKSRVRTLWPGRINLLGPRAFHRITKPKRGTWTLFVHGRRCKGWGFLDHSSIHGLQSEYLIYFQPYNVERQRDWIANSPRARDLRARQSYRPSIETWISRKRGSQ